jgi:hypothetical protein
VKLVCIHLNWVMHDATIITLIGFYSTKLDIYINQNNSSLFRQKKEKRRE